MTVVGEILRRKSGDGPAKIRVVGVRNGRYIESAADEFAPPFELAPNELAERYGGSGELIPEIDESEGWKRFGDNYVARLAQATAPESMMRPEQKLAAEAGCRGIRRAQLVRPCGAAPHCRSGAALAIYSAISR
jgi:hypothetical protein